MVGGWGGGVWGGACGAAAAAVAAAVCGGNGAGGWIAEIEKSSMASGGQASTSHIANYKQPG